MLAAARAGVIVLTRHGRLQEDGTTDGDPVVTVDDLQVAGFEDPLESAGGTFEGRLLELKENSFLDARRQLLEWFASLPERPDVVLVHRHGLAHALLDALAEEGGAPVLILTGHDHHQHVETEGVHVLVDGGSVGAGGAFGVGEEPSGFALVHLDADEQARVVDLVEVEPATGAASAHRVVIPELEPADAAGRLRP
jgi:hypothetical protein